MYGYFIFLLILILLLLSVDIMTHMFAAPYRNIKFIFLKYVPYITLGSKAKIYLSNLRVYIEPKVDT